MTECMHRNLPFLQLLLDTKSDKQRRSLLKTATPSQVRALSEICHETIYGNCEIDDDCRRNLRLHVERLKAIASPELGYGQKKKRINEHSQQGGGFFSILAPILGTILPAIFGKQNE